MVPRYIFLVALALWAGWVSAAPAWSPPVMLSEGGSVQFGGPAFDAAGRAYVALIEPGVGGLSVLRGEPATGSWTSLGAAQDCPAGSTLSVPARIATDAPGRLTLAFSCRVGTSSTKLVARRFVDGAWLAAQVIAEEAGQGLDFWLAADATGRSVLVYGFGLGLSSRVLEPATGLWSAATTLQPQDAPLAVNLQASADGSHLVLVSSPTVRKSSSRHRGGLAAWRYSAATGSWGPMQALPRARAVDLYSCMDVSGRIPVTVTNGGEITVLAHLCSGPEQGGDRRLMAWRFEGSRWSGPQELAASADFRLTVIGHGDMVLDTRGRPVAALLLAADQETVFVLDPAAVQRTAVGTVAPPGASTITYAGALGADGSVAVLWSSGRAALRRADGSVEPLATPPLAFTGSGRLARAPGGALLWLELVQSGPASSVAASWLQP